MDPVLTLKLAITGIDALLSLINNIKAQSGLTTDAIIAHADATDATNKDQIKALLAS